MTLPEILQAKEWKTKQQVALVAGLLQEGRLPLEELVESAAGARAPAKGTCLEALELALREKPALATAALVPFLSSCLADKAPRVKWEAARVAAHLAAAFPEQEMLPLLEPLLAQAGHDGTVVRWSAATALAALAARQLPCNERLLPELKRLLDREEKASIRKIYEKALRQARKK